MIRIQKRMLVRYDTTKLRDERDEEEIGRTCCTRVRITKPTIVLRPEGLTSMSIAAATRDGLDPSL